MGGKYGRNVKMTMDTAKNYLRDMESKRDKNERYNMRSYHDARELLELISIIEFGNKDISKCAAKVIKNI